MTADTIISRVWSFCTTLRDVGVPSEYQWQKLKALKGAELEEHYVETLRELGAGKAAVVLPDNALFEGASISSGSRITP